MGTTEILGLLGAGWAWLSPSGQVALVVVLLVLVALLALVLLAGAWCSLAAARENADIRAQREAGVQPPLEQLRRAARLNAWSLNPDKARELRAWLELGGVLAPGAAEQARLRARIAELEASAKPAGGAS